MENGRGYRKWSELTSISAPSSEGSETTVNDYEGHILIESAICSSKPNRDSPEEKSSCSFHNF